MIGLHWGSSVPFKGIQPDQVEPPTKTSLLNNGHFLDRSKFIQGLVSEHVQPNRVLVDTRDCAASVHAHPPLAINDELCTEGKFCRTCHSSTDPILPGLPGRHPGYTLTVFNHGAIGAQ